MDRVGPGQLNINEIVYEQGDRLLREGGPTAAQKGIVRIWKWEAERGLGRR